MGKNKDAKRYKTLRELVLTLESIDGICDGIRKDRKDQIAIHWYVGDIVSCNPDLSKKEARKILRQIEKSHEIHQYKQ